MKKYVQGFLKHCKNISIILLLATAKLTAKPLTLEELGAYVQSKGYTVEKLFECVTNGATECSYFILESGGKKYFIKSGEKVDVEVKNYLKLEEMLQQTIAHVESGSCPNSGILIVEALDEPSYGFKAVDDFYAGKIDEEAFCVIQDAIFQKVHKFHQLPVPLDLTPSKMYSERLLERIGVLISEQESVQILQEHTGLLHDILLKELLEIPLVVEDHEGIKRHGSILQMIHKFFDMEKTLAPIQKRVLHGDFHAPNVGSNGSGECVLFDLSDVKYLEDPSWDLAKWLNHVSRLHHVVKNRQRPSIDEYLTLRESQGELLLCDRWIRPFGLKEVREKAIDSFVQHIGVDKALLKVRSAALEFVVNINTMRRHMRQFPYTQGRILCCIVDSFHTFMREYNEFTASQS